MKNEINLRINSHTERKIKKEVKSHRKRIIKRHRKNEKEIIRFETKRGRE